ncbi:hypothetical protein [Rahnella inusitata]|uniref:hypothetical protein n=1 Tax=Rahnella inusitata TaxID=58169 RepID=UPI001BC84276|nr:hypothetical protein [Rahnella inusitata]QUT14103.1 hypothetical protein I2123_15535 [Rahnella inusitata]
MKLVPKTHRAIDESFKTVQSPVYVVTRHGRRRRFLSQSAAMNNLVHFMVTGTFDKACIPTHEPSTPVIVNGHKAEKRGELTNQYWKAYNRTYNRLLKLRSRLREISKWKAKHEEIKKQYAELLSNKPF